MTISMASTEAGRHREYLGDYMCSLENTESVLEFAKSRAGSGSFSLGRRIGINANASQQEQSRQVARWQQSGCASYIASLEDEEVRWMLSSITDNRPVLQAWLSCVEAVVSTYDSIVRSHERSPRALMLVPDSTPAAGGSFILFQRWCGTPGDILVPDAEVVSPLDVTGAVCQVPPRLSLGQRIEIGDFGIPCTRIGTSEIRVSMTVEANIDGLRRTYSASTHLPAVCGHAGEPACAGGSCGAGLAIGSDGNCCAQICAPNDGLCQGDQLAQCSADGCSLAPSRQPCACGCANGACQAPSCSAGSARCGASGEVETCDGCAWGNGVACPTGRSCRAGVCSCPGAQRECGSRCVDLQTDRLNCGGCGLSCLGTDRCVAGLCEGAIRLPSTALVYPLTHVAGDTEFDGHGPACTFDARATLSPGGIEVRLEVRMRETVGDWTEGRGTSLIVVPVTDRTLVGIRSASMHADYRDTNHGLDNVRAVAASWNSSPLVRDIFAVGDTGGNDICSNRSWSSRDCSGAEFHLGEVLVTYRPR